MANTKSAEKRIRQTAVRRDRNRSQRSEMRTVVRNLRRAVDAGEKTKAEELLPETLRMIDSSAQKKIVHRNAAGRSKSRLTRAVARMAG